MKAKLLPALTGLRGIGAVWVVLFHVFHGINFPLIKHGYFGVDLFFILSGFILSHVHAKDFPRYSYREHLRFLQLRIARIYPLHVFILILSALPVLFLPGFAARYGQTDKLDLPHFLATLFLVQNWVVDYHSYWNLPSWSLSVEWLAYLVFPILTLGCTRLVSPRATLLLAALSITFLIVIVNIFAKGHIDGLGYIGSLRITCEFTSGCLLYQYVLSEQSSRLPWKTLAWFASLVILLSLISSVARWGCIFGFALLIIAVSKEAGFVARLLSKEPIMFLGEISFSLYLSHWPLIQLYNWLISTCNIHSTTFYQSILMLIIFLISYLTFSFVELPSRRIGRRLTQRSTEAGIVQALTVHEVADRS